VVIFSRNLEDHIQHPRNVFTELRAQAKPSKCIFGKKHIEYLGHLVGSGELAVPQYRKKALKSFKKPITSKDMGAFVGTMSYYRKFIEGYTEQSSHQSPVTSKKAPWTVKWTPHMENVFSCYQ